MFKVYAQHDVSMGPGDPTDHIYLCEVGTLEEADAIILHLEKLWAEWSPKTTPHPDRRVNKFEGTTIFALHTDGSKWVETDSATWHKE